MAENVVDVCSVVVVFSLVGFSDVKDGLTVGIVSCIGGIIINVESVVFADGVVKGCGSTKISENYKYVSEIM